MMSIIWPPSHKWTFSAATFSCCLSVSLSAFRLVFRKWDQRSMFSRYKDDAFCHLCDAGLICWPMAGHLWPWVLSALRSSLSTGRCGYHGTSSTWWTHWSWRRWAVSLLTAWLINAALNVSVTPSTLMFLLCFTLTCSNYVISMWNRMTFPALVYLFM